MSRKGIGGHQSARPGSHDWITPRPIIELLGPFDLDPCASMTQPWQCARRSFNARDDGLAHEWTGRVWLNPPYETKLIARWMERLACHAKGTALVFARTETDWFHKFVWQRAASVFFFRGRLRFDRPDGSMAPHNSGGPSCLVAYGDRDAMKLAGLVLPGRYVHLRSQP